MNMETYADLLKNKQWLDKRKEILERDAYICKSCHNKSYLNYNIATFSVKPVNKDFSLIIVHDSLNTNINYPKNYAYFLELNKASQNSTLFVIYNLCSNESYIIGFLNVKVPVDKLVIENAVEEELIKVYNLDGMSTEKRSALLLFLNKYRSSLYNRIVESGVKVNKIKELILEQEDSFKWSNILNLHVHHKYYMTNRKPWEYDNEALLTLCWKCHEELHKNTKIKWLDENMNILNSLTPCRRCFGAGVFPEFNHVNYGICFRCDGMRFEDFLS